MKPERWFVPALVAATLACKPDVERGRVVGTPVIIGQRVIGDEGTTNRTLVGYALASGSRFVWVEPTSTGTLDITHHRLPGYEPTATAKEIVPRAIGASIQEERVLVCARNSDGGEAPFGLFRLNPWTNKTEQVLGLEFCQQIQPYADRANQGLPTVVLGQATTAAAPLAYLVDPQAFCPVWALTTGDPSLQRVDFRSIQVVPWDQGFVVASLFDSAVHFCWRSGRVACESSCACTDGAPQPFECTHSVSIDLSGSTDEGLPFRGTELFPPQSSDDRVAHWYAYSKQSPYVYRITLTRPDDTVDELETDLARERLDGTPLDFVAHPALATEGDAAGRIVENVLALERIEGSGDAAAPRLRRMFSTEGSDRDLVLSFPADRITPVRDLELQSDGDQGGKKLAVVWQAAPPDAPSTTLGLLDLGQLGGTSENAVVSITAPAHTHVQVLPPNHVLLARPLDGEAWEANVLDLSTNAATPLRLDPRERLAAPPMLRDGAIVGLVARSTGAWPWRLVYWDRSAARGSVFDLPAPRQDFLLVEPAKNSPGHLLVTHRGLGGYLTHFDLCDEHGKKDAACDEEGSVHRGFLFDAWED